MKPRKKRKDGTYLVGVSFTEADRNLLDHADMYGNFSVYIKNLIKEDMNKNKKEATAAESEMVKMFMNMIGSNQLKDIIQKNQEASVDVSEPKEAEKPKLNKSAIGNLIKKK